MRAVALLLCLAGCFPHDAHKRTLAKLTEGGSLVAGIGVEMIASHYTGADCDTNGHTPGIVDQSCHNKAEILGDVGLALILAGLGGFIATVSTGEDDVATPPAPPPGLTAEEKTAVKLPAGVKPAAKTN